MKTNVQNSLNRKLLNELNLKASRIIRKDHPKHMNALPLHLPTLPTSAPPHLLHTIKANLHLPSILNPKQSNPINLGMTIFIGKNGISEQLVHLGY